MSLGARRLHSVKRHPLTRYLRTLSLQIHVYPWLNFSRALAQRRIATAVVIRAICLRSFGKENSRTDVRIGTVADGYYGLLFLVSVAVAVRVKAGVPPVPETVKV
jgi:hypothetical protein